ncbi:MAG TPA: 2-hydroxy-3-oxopropionate reductase [Candidatus Bathyarchaeota archaeon]|nr:2-hydroxy-3-oxopropionate reductase [Candidatus Bathyarchaeota archaeon]
MSGEKKRIGFIGLGVMGKPMATNLLKAGYPLTVWNRTRSKMNDLVAMGAYGANSPREVAERSDVVITMVTDSPDVEEVILGPNGVIHGARPGLIVIDMSTISPIVTRKVAGELAKKGVKMLDAPVSGGEKGAIEATLSIMVGGPREVFEECLPIFRVLGKKITYMGSTGMGQTAKLCNQVICALNIQAVCEGLMLGAKAGLDLKRLLEAISAGAASSWMLINLGPKMLERDFKPGFKIRHQQKDIRLALALASELKLPLPGTALVQQMLRVVEAEGLGEEGTQAAIVAMEKIAGRKLLEARD